MGGITRSAPIFGLLLAMEEDEDNKENEVNKKDEGAYGGVLTL